MTAREDAIARHVETASLFAGRAEGLLMHLGALRDNPGEDVPAVSTDGLAVMAVANAQLALVQIQIARLLHDSPESLMGGSLRG